MICHIQTIKLTLISPAQFNESANYTTEHFTGQLKNIGNRQKTKFPILIKHSAMQDETRMITI